jgi:hypothetical protein
VVLALQRDQFLFEKIKQVSPDFIPELCFLMTVQKNIFTTQTVNEGQITKGPVL